MSLQVQVADVDWIKIVPTEELSIMVCLAWMLYFIVHLHFLLTNFFFFFFQEGQSKYVDLMAGIEDGSTFESPQV